MSTIDTLKFKLRQFARIAAGRLVGSTLETDGKYLFARDLEHDRLVHRAELTALWLMLIDKGVVKEGEADGYLVTALEAVVGESQQYWPEVKPAPDGRSCSLDILKLRERTKTERWPA